MRLWLSFLTALLISSAAEAQSVQQSGSVTRGHLPAWTTQGVVQDGGTSANPQVNSVAAYGSGGCPISITGTTTAGTPTGQYVQGCLSASNSGVQLSVTPFGGLATQPFIININGTTYNIGGTNWLSGIFDSQFCSVQGSVLYRSGTVWTCLGPGSSGQVLQTQGPNLNPQWAGSGGIGTVTSITAGTGLSGGTIATSGTIALLNPVAVNLGGTGAATLAAHGVLIGNGTTAVNVATPGVSGTVLQSNGASADPTWNSVAGTGTVTSITAGSTRLVVSPSPLVTSGTIDCATATASVIGCSKPDGTTITATTGTLTTANTTVGGATCTPGGSCTPTSKQAVFGGTAGGSLSNSATTYVFVGGATSGASSFATPWPFATGTFKNFYASLSGAPGGGVGYTFTVVVNGSPTTITCTISNSNTTCNDTTHTAAITAGQTVYITSANVGTPATPAMTFGMEFDNP